MERYDDLTDDQLVEIMEDDTSKQRLYDIECAFAGVPLLPTHPGTKPTNKEIKKDVVYFSVGGIKTRNAEDSAKLVELLATLDIVDTEYRAGKSVLVDAKKGTYERNFNVVTEECYSAELLAGEKDNIAAYERAENTYSNLKREYDRALQDRAEVVDAINNRYDCILDTARRHAQMMVEYNRYLDLAEGDVVMAKKFLNDTNSEYQEEFPEFFKEVPSEEC